MRTTLLKFKHISDMKIPQKVMEEILNKVTDLLSTLSPAQWCQSFFTLSAALVLALQVLPQDVRRAMMDYGPRRPKDGKSKSKKEDDEKQNFAGLRSFLKNLTEYGQVPHSWFMHFYITSVSLSCFWACQYLTRGSVLRSIATWQDRAGRSSMSLEQIYIAWLLMALQGSRRLYESLFVFKPGSSPMWFIHWALGVAFYAVISLAVWIEGSGALQTRFDWSPDTDKSWLSAVLFYSVAYFKQNQCHRHLASLKKYTLPTEGWFKYLVCPHYTAECILYLAIAWIAAPPGELFNKSILTAVAFVAVNLGATAKGTKAWYENKFGYDKVADRWIMIPPVY
ncbi:DFG10-like protein [Fusarium denticulatum]|uniref:Polyprenal reductase n=1 Tax=Fusarium denticulatum TaxID=48507 RepID=A0A8H5XF73_9HYPO|nr:DFG10-like protein [Fusarium denticulatum]